MVYCIECVLTNHCSDMRKNDMDSITCHKFKDRNYNNSSRDEDCDSVTEGGFGDSIDNAPESTRNKKFRDVESPANN